MDVDRDSVEICDCNLCRNTSIPCVTEHIRDPPTLHSHHDDRSSKRIVLRVSALGDGGECNVQLQSSQRCHATAGRRPRPVVFVCALRGSGGGDIVIKDEDGCGGSDNGGSERWRRGCPPALSGPFLLVSRPLSYACVRCLGYS